MSKVIGLFHDRNDAFKAKSQLDQYHLLQAEAEVRPEAPSISFEKLTRLNTHMENFRRNLLIVGFFGVIIGTIAMVALGQVGKAGIGLPTIAATALITCYVVIVEFADVLKSRRISTDMQLDTIELIVSTEQTSLVDTVMREYGADNVKVEAA